MPMTHKERVLNAFERKPVDRLAYTDSLWNETRDKYVLQGKMLKDEDFPTHFDASIRTAGWMNNVANIDIQPRTVEETEETIVKINGNGAKLRYWKNKTGTPEHIDYAVKDRRTWEENAKPFLKKFDRRRIDFDVYKTSREKALIENRAFSWSGLAPFEQIQRLCGHEYMLMGMALDPEWVKDMVMTYAGLTVMHLDELFSETGVPDFCWFYEDMGFKEKPFISPEMYEAIMLPGHKRLFDFAHSKGCKVMVHSCGYVEPLIPGLIKAGMDCLQAMEVKAGMDMPRLAKMFGERISFCGGVDIRVIASNDLRKIEDEINRSVMPLLRQKAGYILHSDHSIPPEVEHETLRYFFNFSRSLL